MKNIPVKYHWLVLLSVIVLALFAMSSAAKAEDLSNFVKPNDMLLATGKGLFMQQCFACHGMTGKGDGPAAAALNPKPRNFTDPKGWKNGRKFSEIFSTISTGLGVMPSFAALPVNQRAALVHYVRTLAPNAPKDSPSEIKTLIAKFGGAPKKRLPLDFTIDRMAVDE